MDYTTEVSDKTVLFTNNQADIELTDTNRMRESFKVRLDQLNEQINSEYRFANKTIDTIYKSL
jgi:regulation of enolase protein 1 (concanavalin A-like superfamily)